MRAMAMMTLVALVVLPPVPAPAQPPPPPDPAAIWSIQGENASVTTSGLSDRDYTNGIRLGWASAEGGEPAFLDGVADKLWGGGARRIGVDFSQQIYTPTVSNAANPPLTERPYAGVLLGTVSLIQDNAATRSVLALALGVVGPAALGEQVQNGFHDLIGQQHKYGWRTQLHNEPLLEITSERSWRLPLGGAAGAQIDALPEITVALGTLRNAAQAGLTLRLGQGLDSDFGVARLRPGLTGTDVFFPTRDVAWYAFAGADAQAVASDVTLDGNTWEDGRGVSIRPLVAEFQAGAALMIGGTRLTLAQVFQTQQYQHQKGGLHQFSSLALSLRF